MSETLDSPTPRMESLRLAPHPTAPRASRAFVSRTLSGWQSAEAVPGACVVVSELVANAMTHAETDIDLSIALRGDAIRLTVRDGSPEAPLVRCAPNDRHGRGLTIVAGFSRAWGVLPTHVGGKVVWAVIAVAGLADRPTGAMTASGHPSPKGDAGPAGLPCSRS